MYSRPSFPRARFVALGTDPSLLIIPDHVGGHIYSSTWVPSSSLDHRMPELVRTLKDKEKVVFHCTLSQQRGPSAALRYARERERTLGEEESKKQEVYVLEGGFNRRSTCSRAASSGGRRSTGRIPG